MEPEIHIIHTDMVRPKEPGENIFQCRKNIVHSMCDVAKTEVSILIGAYGRLGKTKECVESVLKYTTGIEYQLILVDNGSTDDGATLEYFKHVPHDNKIIYRVTKNVENLYSLITQWPWFGKYCVSVSNDIVVTPNWLHNLLAVMESDDRIGMLCPMSSNTSNLQQVDLPFSNPEEMEQVAQQFNRSDPRKWQQRMRLVTPMSLFRTEVFLAYGGNSFVDYGYFHDFVDDDLSFQVRRAGYKLVVAGDTWVHHNHNVWKMENKDPEEFQKSLEIGRQNFIDKYQGIDSWDDVNNFWMVDITPKIPTPKDNTKKQILGVDVKCGTPILDVKNRLREFGIFEADLSAFTQLAKYVPDLNTICTGIVACDREEFFARQFPQNYYDYIVVDQPLNRYHEPQQMLDDWFSLLKPGGLLMFPLLNTFSFREYLYGQGQTHLYNREFAYNIPPEAVQATIDRYGVTVFTTVRNTRLSQEDLKFIKNQLPAELSQKKKADLLGKLVVDKYFWAVQKCS